MPIQNVLELFAQQLKTPFGNQDTHAHVTVDMVHVSESGEIATSWLSSFSIATWMDIIYKCQHCKQDFKSLNGLLIHLKSVSAIKAKIKCAECERSYSALNSYINHVTKCHHEHLSFW